MRHASILVIGAGIGGLTAAIALGTRIRVLEVPPEDASIAKLTPSR